MERNVVSFLTQNQKLCDLLQRSLRDLAVIKAENIEDVNSTIKHKAVAAVVLHVRDANGWLIFDLMKTGYPDTPRFAILAPGVSGKGYDAQALAKQYGASAILTEKDGIGLLATLIEDITHLPEEAEEPVSDTKTEYVGLYDQATKELHRLLGELHVTGLRTLPQSQIGKDSRDRLNHVVRAIKAIRIKP